MNDPSGSSTTTHQNQGAAAGLRQNEPSGAVTTIGSIIDPCAEAHRRCRDGEGKACRAALPASLSHDDLVAGVADHRAILELGVGELHLIFGQRLFLVPGVVAGWLEEAAAMLAEHDVGRVIDDFGVLDEIVYYPPYVV